MELLGENSYGDVSDLVKYVNPLLVTYKVNAYLAGHDHILEVYTNNALLFYCLQFFVLPIFFRFPFLAFNVQQHRLHNLR